MANSANAKAKRREVNRGELIRYMSERGKVSYIFDSIEKLEDDSNPLENNMATRLNMAISHRLALLKKYLPDEKSVEIKNAEGETFKSDGKWTVEFMNATPESK